MTETVTAPQQPRILRGSVAIGKAIDAGRPPSRWTVARMAQRGEIPAVKLAGKWCAATDALATYVAALAASGRSRRAALQQPPPGGWGSVPRPTPRREPTPDLKKGGKVAAAGKDEGNQRLGPGCGATGDRGPAKPGTPAASVGTSAQLSTLCNTKGEER